MKQYISLILAISLGLCPAMYAAEKKHLNTAAKSAYPTHVVSLYEAAKDGYYELKGKGYNSGQITIRSDGIVGSYTTAHTIGDVTYYNTYQNCIPCEIEAYKLGLMEGDKAAAVYRQTAEYAALKNDTEVANWLYALLGAVIVQNHQSTFLSVANTLTIIGMVGAGLLALIAYCGRNHWEKRNLRAENTTLKYQRDRLQRELGNE
jgi:hypothetical protein